MAAVTASISVGLGTKRALKPFEKHFKGGRALFLNFLVSFLAVGSAGCINVILMRSKEIQEGIMLKDEDGQELGKSKIIGKKAVFQTGSSRYVMPLAPLLIPTVAFYMLEQRKLIPKNKAAKLALESIIFLSALTYAPSMACAMFPQVATASVEDLEPEFNGLKKANGSPVEKVFYNKGL